MPNGTSVIPRILSCFEQNRDRPFLVESMTRKTWTYREFLDRSLRAATFLREQGVGKGDRVAFLLANSAEFAALYFGCLFIGAVAVPINQALHHRDITFILSTCGARLLLFSRCTRPIVLQCIEGIPDIRQVRVTLGQEQSFHPEDGEEVWSCEHGRVDPGIRPLEGVSDEDPLIILFTSGTSGRPKGVVHSFASEFGNAATFNSVMGFGPANRFLHIWPMAYSTGYLNTLLSPFMAGGSVVLACAFTAQTILSFWRPVLDHGANTLWLSPTMLASLLRLDRDPAGPEYSRKHQLSVCVGTAPLPLRLRRDFEAKYGVVASESYGLSELLLISANRPADASPDNSVGKLLPGVELKICGDDGLALPNEGEGEIYVRSPFSLMGYLDADTGSLEPIDRRSWFATGDIGRIDEGGSIFITSRKKDLIIRGGQNLSPRAIGDVLLAHPSVEEVLVLGLPHDFYGEEVAAVFRLRENKKLAEERPSILDHARKNLSHAGVPTRLFQIEEFPTGATGKILAREVRDRILGGQLSE